MLRQLEIFCSPLSLILSYLLSPQSLHLVIFKCCVKIIALQHIIFLKNLKCRFLRKLVLNFYFYFNLK